MFRHRSAQRFHPPTHWYAVRYHEPKRAQFDFPSLAFRGWPRLPFTARIERYTCSFQARSLSLQGWGLIDLLLRATFSPAHPLARRDVPVTLARAFLSSFHLFRGVAKAALNCAHRTSTVSPCAFCEQGGHLAAPSPFSLKGRRRVCYTALPLNDRTAQQFLRSSLWNEKRKPMC